MATKSTTSLEAAAVSDALDLNAPYRDARPSWLKVPRANVSLIVSVLLLAIVVLWAILPGAFAPYDPYVVDGRSKLLPPSADHLFGTDGLGRDLFSRFIWGTRTTLVAAGVALLLAFVVSSVLGLLAGYLGGTVDDVIGRVLDIFLAVPGLLISLMLVTALGFGSLNIAIAVGVSSIAAFARVMRAEVFRIRHSDFVTSARLAGVSWYVILWRHIFPHAIGPVLALTALQFGSAIMSISALSFLGFGAQAPEPEWGNIISGGRAVLRYAWWISVVPGTVIVLVVLATNRLSRYLERIG
ncbi:MAG: ABC transporter permease [Pseudochelatococcus sp.]|jgi:peptide/nickel transport system permease protein|uniref:ABC transporter permease n=1 Tax=Pseudochelatococcus sp. TaxID=2020869 RepID=UPI003D8CED89